MSTVYNNIYKLFLNKEYFNKYNKYIDQDFLRQNLPDYYKLFKAFEELHHDSTNNDSTTSDLQLVYERLYPSSQGESVPIKAIENSDALAANITEYLEAVRRQAILLSISLAASRLASGTGEHEDLNKLFQELDNKTQVNEDDFEFVSDDLQQLFILRRKDKGLRWRLPSLQRALGPLRSGDFGFLAARPETGKTTFLASECSYMATQTDKPIIWFNNEEQGTKVMVRVYQAVFGVDLNTLYGNIEYYKTEYEKTLKGKIKIYDRAILRKKDVEGVLDAVSPALVIFDQIDKVQGFTADRPDLEHKLRYQWAREMAKLYSCPVIGICQAGASAENKKWLSMNDIDSSKTAKQGEADWILGIGAVFDEGKETLRYFHLPKNKLDGDENTDPTLRHGKWYCNIRPEIARYED